MAITAAQVKKQRAQLRRELEKDQRKAARAELAELVKRLRAAKAERKRLLRGARAVCRRARVEVQPKAKAIRARHLLAARDEVAALRASAAGVCRTAQHRAEARAASSRARAGAALDAAQRYQGELARAAKRPKADRAAVARAAVERAHESDDEVRNNLPDELHAVWEARASKTKPSERRTRTEAFLEWAHDHPADVQTLMTRALERDIAKLERDEAAQRRELKSWQTARARSARELRNEHLAAAMVPF